MGSQSLGHGSDGDGLVGIPILTAPSKAAGTLLNYHEEFHLPPVAFL